MRNGLTCVALSLAMWLASASGAHAQTSVFSQTLRGDMVATGNTLGLDSAASPANTPGTRGAIGAFIANPLEFPTAASGTFPAGTTQDASKNGSEAVLDLPPGVSVAHAELFWACSSQTGGVPATPATTPNNVVLTLPGGVKQTVSATGEDTGLTLLNANNKFYARWANVTGAIATGGGGRYMVSRVAGVATTSAVTACGWTLFVVYESDTLPLKNINLWITSEEVRYNGAGCPCETQIDVSGFCTPPSPADPTGAIYVTAMEGDALYYNDSFNLEDPYSAGDYLALGGPNNAYDNFFSSQINKSDGTLDTRGTFGTKNHVVDPNNGATHTLVAGARTGWDITTVPINDWLYNPDVLKNSQSNTSLLVTSGGAVGVEGDDFVVGAVGLALDVASPFLTSEHDVDHGSTFVGDTLTSTIRVYNEGNGPADEVFFCFAFPSNVTFTGDFTVAGAVRAGITVGQLAPTNCANHTGGVSIGAIPAGGSKVVTLKYKVDGLAPPNDKVTVTPSFHSAWTPACNAAPLQEDTQVGESRVITGKAIDVALAVTPTTPPAVSAGATLTYTTTVTNTTSAALSGAVLRIAIPAGTSFVNSSVRVNGQAAGATFTYGTGAALPTIPAGAAATVSFQVTVTMTTAGIISETAYVDVDGAGTAPEKASNTVVTQVQGQVVEPTDTDHDGIPDTEDNCPLVPNPQQENTYDGSGFNPGAVDEGDVCDDSDGDGLLDSEEDPGADGYDSNETDATDVDTDGDGLCDGQKTVAPCSGFEDSDGDKNHADWGGTETSPINPDTDGDGICDGVYNFGACKGGESTNGTNPLRTDSDKDGLCDGPGATASHGAFDHSNCKGDETGGDGDYDAGTDTNPARSDTDNDLLCDGFQNGATDCQGSEDADGDRVAGDFALAGSETNPLDPDTDDGGVKDGVEVLTQHTDPRDRCVGDLVNCEVHDDDNDGIPNDQDTCTDRDHDGYGVGPNCLGPDCNDLVPECTTDCVTDRNGADGNGIPDCEEKCDDADQDGYGVGPSCYGSDCDETNPQCNTDCSDFDNDGRSNCADPDDDDDGLPDQAEATHGTDTRNPDTDGDGLLDGAEVNTYGSDPKKTDSDGDQIPDGVEVNQYHTDPAVADSDSDGLDDGDEVSIYHTDPTQGDTDLDGVDDATEVRNGSDPTNPADGGKGSGTGKGSSGCAGGAGGGAGWLAGLGLLVAFGAWRRRRVAGAVGVAGLAAILAFGGDGMLGGRAEAAGPDGFSLNHFLVKPGVDRIFMVEGTEVAPAWAPYGGIWAHYLSRPLTFHNDATNTDTVVVDSLLQLEAGVGFGIAGIGELEVILPLTLTSSGDETRLANLGSFAMGDLLARLRFAILKRDDGKDGFGLNLGVTVGIPSGDAADGSGDGGVRVAPNLALSLGVGPLLVALDAGVDIRTQTLSFANLNFDHELTFGLGAQVQATDFFAVGAEVFGRAALTSPFAENPETPIEVVGGVKFRMLGGLQVEVGGGTGIVHGYGAPEWRVFGGVQWAPYANDPDSDGDGISDSKDKCPNEPEDKDGFQDADGCPDLDDDSDGVPDKADKCRLEPEDIDNFEDGDGCPDVDNDKDNIPDASDKCPNTAEDKDGFEDEDGCPDPDNDKDGILDDVDKCIDQPETVNEYQDDDGCPDSPPLARLENCKIVIGEKVYFDAGKATIKPVSFPLLNEVARIIRENPGIVRVDIEGHTDSDGSASYNRGLSDKRAKAVRTYLIGQGLKSGLLTGKGYGEDKPIAPNTSPEGKEKNRRVEFLVKNADCKR